MVLGIDHPQETILSDLREKDLPGESGRCLRLTTGILVVLEIDPDVVPELLHEGIDHLPKITGEIGLYVGERRLENSLLEGMMIEELDLHQEKMKGTFFSCLLILKLHSNLLQKKFKITRK